MTTERSSSPLYWSATRAPNPSDFVYHEASVTGSNDEEGVASSAARLPR